ncbi:MAG: DUF4350 domain-containing protein [Flavobacteriales bacterium]
MVRSACSLALIITVLAAGCSQQVPDTAFTFRSSSPAYKNGAGPVVMLDEAHNNFHTLGGRYYTFGKVLSDDGYRMMPGTGPFTAAYIQQARILVIANALSPDEDFALPTRSAFTTAEIAAVEQWVAKGGSLFLIADHMPFGGAAHDLGAAFGFDWINGYAIPPHEGTEMFTRRDGSLLANPITDGSDSTRIDSIALFTGSAFHAPPEAMVLTRLKAGYEILLPQRAGELTDSTSRISGDGFINGAMVEYGKGRIVAFGEAALFSAQLSGPSHEPMGMNQRGAEQDPQFLLNIIHWLDERL